MTFFIHQEFDAFILAKNLFVPYFIDNYLKKELSCSSNPSFISEDISP